MMKTLRQKKCVVTFTDRLLFCPPVDDANDDNKPVIQVIGLSKVLL
jgi:hypothetical protein